MITKKEKIMGMELQRELSPIQAIRSSFDVAPPGAPVIRHGTEQYRRYVKKRVEESRGIRWGGLTTGAQKEVLGVRKARQLRGNRMW